VDLTAPEPAPRTGVGATVHPADPADQTGTAGPAGLDPARELAEQLRGQGVVVVASRALAAARPEGVDLLGALGVLTREVAQEWFEAADTLPLLDVDRLQVRSASALLSQASTAVVGDAVPSSALDVAAVARAATLRTALQSGAAQDTQTANQLLDRTWAVLCDLRRLVTEQPPDTVAGGLALGVVPSAAEVDPEVARSLPPALNRAASAGALVGLLAPWLPRPHTDPLVAVDTLLHGVSSMARAVHDRAWWSAMTTVGRVSASLSVAAAYACATGYAGTDRQACALTLSEPALELLVEQAVASARAVAGAPTEEETRVMPAASPSQQARAAAERAAAERRATQQAFVERAQATRAARHEPPVAPTEPAVDQAGPAEVEEPAASGPVPAAASIPAQAPPTAPADRPHRESADAPPTVPSIAEVRAELGEAESVEETEEIDIGVWDTLMRPR